MKHTITILTITVLAASCQVKTQEQNGLHLEDNGNILTINYLGEVDVVQFKMFQGLHAILKEEQPGIFKNKLEIPDLDNAVFSYEIIVHKKDSTGKLANIPCFPENGERYFSFIGKNRHVSFNKAEKLSGILKDTLFNSQYLKEKRQLTIYYPSIISNETPIFYLTDGSSVNGYAPYIDQLIAEKKIPPIMLVGIHSSKDERYKEYVKNDSETFYNHRDFFFNEVIPEIEKGLDNWKGKRYMYGVSNGAAFCMYSGINHPELFAKIIAFSTVDYISEFGHSISFDQDSYPHFYIGVGRYEESIFRDNKKFIQKLKKNNIDYQFKEFISGHDGFVWQVEFLEYLTKGF